MKKKSTSRSAFFKLRVVLSLLLVSGGIALALAAFSKANAQQDSKDQGRPKQPVQTEAQYRGVLPVTHFDVSPPLRDMKPIYPGPKPDREIEERGNVPTFSGVLERDPVVQSQKGEQPDIAPPSVSFDAQPNVGGFSPPDPNGDVGPNHIVAMSNVHFQIFTKTGTSLFGPVATNTLWAGFGGGCQNRNDGDPVVLHDQLSNRWVLMQFTAAAPYLLCVAVSQTPDPTGAYYRYSIATGGGNNFADYPKMGIWPDGYYFSTREFAGGGPFAGVGAYVMNRAQAVAGNPSPTVISFLAPPAGAPYNVGDGLLPSDLDGSTLPPAGRSNYFVGSMDNNGPYGAPQDALTVWKFTVDFVTPANSSFVLVNTVPVAAFNSILGLCGGTRACIPQPGTANRVDHLGYRQRPLHRLAYRNFGTHESLVTNQSVSAGAGPNGEVSGVRWWELRSPSSSPFIHQQGTYAPGVTDGIHRWMGSIAMDGGGNMGLAYSASNGTNPALFPSIWYTGRNAGSALGTMPLGENSIITGTGSQTGGGNRWGDYSSITVDPVDDATFWVVNQYNPTTSDSGWRLRVGAFKLVPVAVPTLGSSTLTAESCTPPNMAPDPGETVTMSLCISNTGDLATTNVVGTLPATGGVTMPSGPQNYGAIPPGGTVCRTFTFVASGVCGGTITPSLQIQDGATNFGTPSYPSINLGIITNTAVQNFDGVSIPLLPAGWTTSSGGGGVGGFTDNISSDTLPNNLFLAEVATVGLSGAASAPIAVPAGGAARVNFRLIYNTELNRDGLVLEISIPTVAGGAFQDILAAGGSFVSGGYTGILGTGFSNPLPGRQAWSGLSAGTAAAPAYITSVVNLPAAAAGQNIRLQWRQGSDSSGTPSANPGSRVDTISLSTVVCATSCSAAPVPLSAVSRKTHGGQGDFDINLPLSGTSGVECRRGQGTGQNDHTIVVTFGGAASVSGSPQAQVTSGTGVIGSNGVPNGGAVTVSGSTVTIPLTSVANAQVVTVTLNGVTVGANSGNVVIPMGVLLGDTNDSRNVQAGDTLQTRGRSGQLTDGTNFRSDVNPDGAIAAGDVLIVRGQSGNSIP